MTQITATSLGTIASAAAEIAPEPLIESLVERLKSSDPIVRAVAAQNVLSDLRDIEADALQQDVKTRAASRAAARKIEKLTAQLDQLPLTAAAPEPDTAELLVPAGERPD
jgi:hypothetical protein